MRALLALVVLAPLAAGLTVEDPAGDVAEGPGESSPDFDLLRIDLVETATALELTVEVAGAIREPVGGLFEYALEFRIVPAEARALGAPDVAGTRHTLGITSFESYALFRAGGGYALPDQPSYGAASATWTLPKLYMDAAATRRPLAGDWIVDARVDAMDFGVSVDNATLPDFALAVDTGPGAAFHLRGDGTLTREAPASDRDAAAVAAPLAPAAWRSAPLAAPFPLPGAHAAIWLAATSTTPAIANEDVRVGLFDESPDGSQRLVAVREEELAEAEDSFTNLFLVPGVPQRLPFRLVALGGASAIEAGHRLVLHVEVHGFLVGADSGPVVVLCEGPERDSVVVAGP